MTISSVQKDAIDAMLRSARLERAKIFGDAQTDRPIHATGSERDGDSDIPQIGFIGPRYKIHGLVAIGYNPGNGATTQRTSGDQALLPALQRFQQLGNEQSFLAAMDTALRVSQSWRIWHRHVLPWIDSVSLNAEQIAYLNINPFRTASKSKFPTVVWDISWKLHVQPLLDVLRPKVVVGLGNDVARYLAAKVSSDISVVRWNRSQAATASALSERAEAIVQLKSFMKPK